MRGTLEERFWSKVAKKSSDACWEWKGCKDGQNYGMFWLDGTSIRAHRMAWELNYKRKVPKGMLILHHCDNPSCVNHWHLYCETDSNNAQDMVKRGRQNLDPIIFRKAILSAKAILYIRSQKGRMSQSGLARLFGISRDPIIGIWNRNKYPCIEGYYVDLREVD